MKKDPIHPESARVARSKQVRGAQLARVEQIASLHRQCREAELVATERLRVKVGIARKCGETLIELKRLDKSASWCQRFKSPENKATARTNCPEGKAVAFVRMARKSKRPGASVIEPGSPMNDLLLAIGEIEKKEGAQALHTFSFTGLLSKKAFGFIAAWGKHVKSQPIDTWPEYKRENALEELEWFARQYKALGGKL